MNMRWLVIGFVLVQLGNSVLLGLAVVRHDWFAVATHALMAATWVCIYVGVIRTERIRAYADEQAQINQDLMRRM